MARPTFITVHLIVVSSNTTWHDMCLLTQHWNQERKKKKRDKKKEWLKKFERKNTRYIKDNSWARSNFSKGNYSCSGSGKNNIIFLMGIAINLSFLFFLPLTYIRRARAHDDVVRIDICKHASISLYSLSQLFDYHFFIIFSILFLFKFLFLFYQSISPTHIRMRSHFKFTRDELYTYKKKTYMKTRILL